MRISHKKGFVLALAIYFMILAAITSVGMYAYAGYIMREVGIGKKASVRGYYCAVAGARYAYILLKDPVAKLGPTSPYVTSNGITTLEHNGEIVTLTIGQSSGLGQDLLLYGDDALTVTVEENSYNPSTGLWQWTPDDGYRVIATFTT